MSKRITIVLSDDTHKKVRLLQAKKIATSPNSVSFSKVIEELIIKGLKK